jgi:hypothetical protein
MAFGGRGRRRRLYDEGLRQAAHCGKQGFVEDLRRAALESDFLGNAVVRDA